MFGQYPVISIDLIFPNRLEYTKERILENCTVFRSELSQAIIAEGEKIDRIDILRDIDPAYIEPKCSAHVHKYIDEKQNRFKASFVLLEILRILKMNQARKSYNRKVKKVEYEIGDLVLACHPALKRGLSRGFSTKIYWTIPTFDFGCPSLFIRSLIGFHICRLC